MKAIQTRYLGPTSRRSSRIKAWAEGVKPLTIPYPHEAAPGQHAHMTAAEALCVRQDWPTDLVGGGLANHDYVFCFREQR